jgi:hypothetical protein
MARSIEVTVVDAPSALPCAGSVGGEQGKRLWRKAALDSGPLKVDSGFFRWLLEVALSNHQTCIFLSDSAVRLHYPVNKRVQYNTRAKVCIVTLHFTIAYR